MDGDGSAAWGEQVKGELAMMAEIAARGPIGCGMCVTRDFEAYAGEPQHRRRAGNSVHNMRHGGVEAVCACGGERERAMTRLGFRQGVKTGIGHQCCWVR